MGVQARRSREAVGPGAAHGQFRACATRAALDVGGGPRSDKPFQTHHLRLPAGQTENRDGLGTENAEIGAFRLLAIRSTHRRNPAWRGDFRQEKGPGENPSPSIWWPCGNLKSRSEGCGKLRVFAEHGDQTPVSDPERALKLPPAKTVLLGLADSGWAHRFRQRPEPHGICHHGDGNGNNRFHCEGATAII